MSIEMALRLAAEWRARTEPLPPVASARRAPDPAPLPADELAWLEADLAARALVESRDASKDQDVQESFPRA